MVGIGGTVLEKRSFLVFAVTLDAPQFLQICTNFIGSFLFHDTLSTRLFAPGAQSTLGCTKCRERPVIRYLSETPRHLERCVAVVSSLVHA